MSLTAIGRYTAALALVGIFSGAAPAFADPVPEAAPSVNFSGGGLGVLLCGSRPNVPKISIVAETKVRLVNGLGQSAELRIDGQAKTSVSDGDSIEVQFHRGPVKVAMVPSCLLNLNPTFEPLTVDVTRKPGSTAPTQPRPTRPKVTPPPGSPAAPAPVQSPGTPNESDLTIPPPEETLFPTEPGAAPNAGFDGQSPVTVGNSGEPQFAGRNTPTDKGPIGLLAIIATVCVVGVLSGAIRAIITQRASRAEFA